MTERIENGHYRVDSEEFADDRKNTSSTTEYGVIRGDVANDAEYGVFGGQFGFSASKWYAYKLQKTSLVPKLDFSPTAPRRAFKKSFSEFTFAQEAFDTKKGAVSFVENEWV